MCRIRSKILQVLSGTQLLPQDFMMARYYRDMDGNQADDV
jgi:hypothetical protein